MINYVGEDNLAKPAPGSRQSKIANSATRPSSADMHLGSTAVYLPGSAMHLGSAKSFSAPNNESNAQKSAKIL